MMRGLVIAGVSPRGRRALADGTRGGSATQAGEGRPAELGGGGAGKGE